MSLAVLLAAAFLPARAAAQAQDTTHVVPPDSAGWFNRAQLRRYLRTWPGIHRVPPEALWHLTPEGTAARVAARFDSAVTLATARLAAAASERRLLQRLPSFTRDTMRIDERRGLFGLSANTADVAFDGSLRFQVSTVRQRNLACTPALVQIPSSGCSGGFSAPRVDNVVQLTSTGIFAQRFHINVDFLSTRDYAAGNIVNGYYQGLEDEKLQRVEIGTQLFNAPPSRFLTATIPSNNFGIGATAVFGPLRLQGIAATQKGSVVAKKNFTIGNGTQQPVDNLTRDLDYEPRRLFWVVDPKTLPGYPGVDILDAGRIGVSDAARPARVRIYRYLSANRNSGANANYDGITAVGTNGAERTGAIRWRLLQPNIDYWLDPSGLWFIIAGGQVDPNDYLAVSYVTAGGATVGTFPATDNPSAADTVRLIYLPNKGPTSPVYPFEMRQAYRAGGSSLIRSSLRATITVANSERPDSAPGTFLDALGLSFAAEPGTLNVADRVFPRTRDPGAAQVIKDAFLVFPSAQPFGSPRLTARERNDSLYVTPEYLLFTQGPASKFIIRLQYDAQGGTDRSSIRLDAIDITEGSERLELNGRRLTHGTDYQIDYNTGRVDFLDPVGLFGTGTANVTATYEQRGLFAQAPTSIAGLTATLTLGRFKTISVAGLYQAEASGYTRPQIGSEARASLLAGVTGDFLFDTPWLTRFLNGLVGKPSTAPSSFRFGAEVALSHPDLNRSGAAYLEEFEDDRSILIPARQNAWIQGSVPTTAAGLQAVLQSFDSADAVQLTVQNLVPNARDSITQLSPHDIDPTIALTQSKSPTIEPVLWMTLQPDTAGGIVDSVGVSHWTQPRRPGRPRWRTLTTPLSTTGADLSRNDYLEFALYETSDKPIETSQMRIVFDLGKVSEDALSIAPTRYYFPGQPNDTFYAGRQYVGVHRLDSERTFFGTWSATTDDNGILGDRPDSLIGPTGNILRRPALCMDSLSAVIHFGRWGDLSSRCSNHNGFADTEDLDGDNILDAQGPEDDVFRYVVDLRADSAKYFVRSHVITDPKTGLPVTDRLGRTARWTIYRVPLRAPADTVGTPDIHLIKHLRMAFLTPPDNGGVDSTIHFALALMKFTGAAWVARADRPILSLSGPTAQLAGTVVIGTVSTQDSLELGYRSPPGIGNATTTVATSSSQFSQQINEKSLRIQATDLPPGQRAEAYTRLPSSSRNLLAYRTLRVWMRGRPGTSGWDGGPLQAYIKVGSDAYNFYLYRAPVRSTTWDPEMVIDLQTWQDLRAQIENARLRGAPPGGSLQCAGTDSTAYVACTPDGSYVVQVRDPQINPPNLVAVQEIAAGFYYAGSGAPIGRTELWVDDIRVSQPVSTTGLAGAMTARLVASDVGSIDVAGVYQSGQFHQMTQAPTYQNAASLVAVSSVHMEKFLPPRLGLLVPVTVSTNLGWVEPQLLDGSDVQARGLQGLRRPRNDATTWSLNILDPVRQNSSRIARLLLHPLSFSASGSAAKSITSLSQATSSTWLTSLNYALSPQRRAFSLHLGGLARRLPRWLRASAGGEGLAKASFAPVPTLMVFTSSLSHTIGDLQAFQLPVKVLADTILKPLATEQFLWRNAGSVNWQPFTMLTVTSALSSTRDLRQYSDSTTLGRVVNAQHRSLLGTDVGVERDRNLSNSLRLAPRLSSWLGSEFSVGTNFFLSRSLTTRNPVRIEGDTAGAYILPQTLSNSRFTEFRFTVDPQALSRRLFGDSSRIARATVRFRPIDISRRHTYESTYDLATFTPGLSYQLALGNLNSFLSRNGQDAIGAAEGVATSVAASVDLPDGFSAQLSYTSTASDRYQHQAGPGFLKTTATTQSWPSGRFIWSRSFANGPILRLGGGSSVQRDRATSSSPFGDGPASLATSETDRVAPNLSVTFRNGVFATFDGEIDRSDASFSGNNTQTRQFNLSGTVSWSLRLPQVVSRLRRTLLTTIRVSQNTNSSCIQRTADTTCVPYYDLRRLEVNSSFAASLQHAIQTGLSFQYVHNAIRSQGLRSATLTIQMFLQIPLAGWGM